MGRQIVRQDDGTWAVFDTVSNQITMWDATEKELEDWLAERAAEDSRRSTRGYLAHFKAGRRPPQHWATWREALAEDRERGGEATAYFDGLRTRGDDA